MSKLAKTSSWIKNFPELEFSGEKVFCKACAKIIVCEKKFQIDQHMKTPLHKAKLQKMKSEPVQVSVKNAFKNVGEKSKSEKEIFEVDLCKALVAANIPLKKLQNPQLRGFLQKYCKQTIPDESTLRKKNVHSVYETVLEEIRASLGDKNFYIVVDESTDACGRYIAHLMIGALQEDKATNPYLIASKQLDKTNNMTITRFIQQSLSSFFLPNPVPDEKFLVLLSDAAPYMVKVGQNLRIFYPNMIHVTCLLHGINRVAETVRTEYPLVNKLISNVKKVFLKAPLRVQLYKERLPGVSLPPEPVITRWGTWIKAAIFYAEHFEGIKQLILDLDDDSQCVVQSKELLKSASVAKDLVFIKVNFSFIPDIIFSLESRNLSLRDSISIVETFSAKCNNIPGKVGGQVRNKLDVTVKKNEGFKYLTAVKSIYEGKPSNEVVPWPYTLLPKLQYCPITSVDVERSFSLYKHIFTDRRQSFLVNNFEKYLVINAFYTISC